MSRNIARSDVKPISTDAQVYFTVPVVPRKIFSITSELKIKLPKIENETLLT